MMQTYEPSLTGHAITRFAERFGVEDLDAIRSILLSPVNRTYLALGVRRIVDRERNIVIVADRGVICTVYRVKDATQTPVYPGRE